MDSDRATTANHRATDERLTFKLLSFPGDTTRSRATCPSSISSQSYGRFPRTTISLWGWRGGRLLFTVPGAGGGGGANAAGSLHAGADRGRSVWRLAARLHQAR